jgi:hypothetical protein
MKLQTGQNTFRILSVLVEGYQVFDKQNKPHNRKIVRDSNGSVVKDSEFRKEELEAFDARKRKVKDMAGNEIEGSYDVRYFWQMFVWNWKEAKFQCLVITQGRIIEAMKSTLQTESPKKKGDYPFADPSQYDFIIIKSGEGLNTTYQVGKMDSEPLPKEIVDTWESITYDADAIFKGTYPFD